VVDPDFQIVFVLYSKFKYMNRFLFCIVLFCFTLFSYGAEPGYGITVQSVIDLRLSPSFAGEMGTQTLMGTPLRVLESVHGWSRLMTPEGYTAWATDESVEVMTKAEYKEWNAAPKLIVTVYFSVLRSQPSETSDVVSDVIWGDIVRNQGDAGNYYKVMTPAGKTAYLQKAFLMPFDQWLATRHPTAGNIIATAKHFIGFPYVWGGTSVKGVDCSGFTKTCYYLNGVILRRDASQQVQTGENVDISKGYDNLKPADLLFFGSMKDGKQHITHVAMYIGNGEFVQSAGTVHISSLIPGTKNYDAFNTKRLLRARRIITKIDKDPGIVTVEKHSWYHLP
jgi:hypothetical protein